MKGLLRDKIEKDDVFVFLKTWPNYFQREQALVPRRDV